MPSEPMNAEERAYKDYINKVRTQLDDIHAALPEWTCIRSDGKEENQTLVERAFTTAHNLRRDAARLARVTAERDRAEALIAALEEEICNLRTRNAKLAATQAPQPEEAPDAE